MKLIQKKILKKTSSKKNEFDWTYQPPKVDNGKQTFDEMSLVQGIYEDFFVLKTGYLTGMIEVNGINLDLLNEVEQSDLFEEYNAFLITTFGESHETLQFRETTTPVDIKEYIKNLKRTYLKLKENEPNQTFKINLIASYIDHFDKIQNKSDMTTKCRTIVVNQKIKSKRLDDLISASKNLREKINRIMKDFTNSLSDYDIDVRLLSGNEYKHIFKDLINFEKNSY